VSGGSVSTRLGTAPAPDLVLSGPPRLILGLLAGYLAPGEAQELGLEISGDPAVLRRVQPDSAASVGSKGNAETAAWPRLAPRAAASAPAPATSSPRPR
jgi:hypothetical protein